MSTRTPLLRTSGGSSKSNLPDFNSVFRINFGADSDTDIDSDSGVDTDSDSGTDSNLGIAICLGNGIRIDFKNWIISGMRISFWIEIRREISPGISMINNRLQVNFDSLRLSIRSIIGPKRLLLWRCRNRLRFEADSDFEDNFDSGADFDSGIQNRFWKQFRSRFWNQFPSRFQNQFQKLIPDLLSGIDSRKHRS